MLIGGVSLAFALSTGPEPARTGAFKVQNKGAEINCTLCHTANAQGIPPGINEVEPDLSLAAAKIALEYQGEDHAEVRRMRADITRGRDLRSAGWTCLYFGPAEVFGRPWTIGPEVRALVRERAPHLLGRPGRAA